MPITSEIICLGKTFSTEDERRDYFRKELRKKLPELKKIEGFPIGEDEDILNLSDPPYYTACPNPWLNDFIEEWEREKLVLEQQGKRVADSRFIVDEPYASDVSEGKNNPIYNAHSYHTKVPHPAIMRYILHYTQPGDIVFDGFAGTGMTGVAAQMCAKPDSELEYRIEQEFKSGGLQPPQWGARKAICGDLSPIASFIAYNYNTPIDVLVFETEAKQILEEVEKECGWMYETLHVQPASSRLIDLIDSIGFEPCDPFKSPVSTYHKDNLPHIQVPGATYFITYRTEKFRVLSPDARQCALDAILFWDNKRWKVFTAVVMPDHVHVVARLLQKEKSQQDAGSTNKYSRHPAGYNSSDKQHPESWQDASSTSSTTKECTEFWMLEEILHSVKSFSANEINKIENVAGTAVWQSESYDRVVRDQIELANELAYVNNNPVKAGLVENAEDYMFRFVSEELKNAGWKPAARGRVNYTVWSDVFICPHCSEEIIFWEAAVDKEAGKVKDEFACSHCKAMLTKRTASKAKTTSFDKTIEETVHQTKRIPVLINYTFANKRFEKIPDTFDLKLIDKIDDLDVPYWFPTDKIPKGDKTGEPLREGITHVHHFYTKRNLFVLAAYNKKFENKLHLKFLLSSILNRSTQMNRIHLKNYFFGGGGWNAGYLKGTLYISSIPIETSVFEQIDDRISSIGGALSWLNPQSNRIFNSSCSNLAIGKNSIDYIFTDPPFGANIMYSELNFLWESWLKVKTDNKTEAIENNSQGKSNLDYQIIMTSCFKEYFRILKPGKWMTVEFSNTSAAVWNGIQTSLQRAGFIVANVAAIDKQQGSFNAVTTTTAVKQDLVISCYKPGSEITTTMNELSGTDGVWSFVKEHLNHLPINIINNNKTTAVIERSPKILYDRMLIFYLMRNLPIPLDVADFQLGLKQKFIERDGMYFTAEQAAQYDSVKAKSGTAFQFDLFNIIYSESDAVEWLKGRLKNDSQTYQDIMPDFRKANVATRKGESEIELKTVLEENFIQESDGQWRVPNMNEAKDREALRTKALLKEFDRYVTELNTPKPKKLKEVRLEALRAGFRSCFDKKEFQTIVTMGDKIPQNLLLEDEQLLMFYDIAKDRI